MLVNKIHHECHNVCLFTLFTFNSYEKSEVNVGQKKTGPLGHGVGEQVLKQSNICDN